MSSSSERPTKARSGSGRFAKKNGDAVKPDDEAASEPANTGATHAKATSTHIEDVPPHVEPAQPQARNGVLQARTEAAKVEAGPTQAEAVAARAGNGDAKAATGAADSGAGALQTGTRALRGEIGSVRTHARDDVRFRIFIIDTGWNSPARAGERTRIINRMKAILAWLGVRGFNPKLRKAPQRLDELRTPEDLPLPPNTVAELRRDMARLAMVCEQIKALEQARLANLEQAPGTGPHAMVRLIASVIGVGIETADMLVQEVLSRNLRDRRAVARFAGLTGAPNESGSRRRERGLAKSGNARVRRGLIQLAWRFLRFQKDSALAQWYRARTEGPAAARRTKMIVALARKLLIAFWRMVTVGEIPAGFALRQPA